MSGWYTSSEPFFNSGSVGHRVKIHKITSATGKERGDIEIMDYVVKIPRTG
jgi:hypothetical protein